MTLYVWNYIMQTVKLQYSILYQSIGPKVIINAPYLIQLQKLILTASVTL